MKLKSFSQIVALAPKVEDVLIDHNKYWAHIHDKKKAELLHEHIQLVNDYANKLIISHHLDDVIDHLILDYTKGWGNLSTAETLKTLFVHSIVFHDFGKINENFQVARMKNEGFKHTPNTALNPIYGHSYLGAFIFLNYHIDRLLKSAVLHEDKIKLICHCFFFSYTILQHHSPALFNVIERGGLFTKFKDVFNKLKCYLQRYQLINIDHRLLMNLFSNIESLWYGSIIHKMPVDQLPLFILIKLNFSILTASDYLATHEYMSSDDTFSAKTEDLGVFRSKQRVEEIFNHLRNYKHNLAVYQDLEIHQFDFPTSKSNENLNFLRKQMAINVIHNIRLHRNKRLYYLEAPTGGGKTNLSAIAVAELLMAHPELNKVFYVFPFTTLITQSFSYLKEAMGLTDSEIGMLYSKARFSRKNDRENTEDGLYGEEKKDFIDQLFALYPLLLLSHVKFFDILKTNQKEGNYLLHRLSNSIVIIDELQSYNPAIWDKILFYLEKYAHYFNIRFILMSATLPKISDLRVGFSGNTLFTNLLSNAQHYLTNINFSGRVTFNFELYDLGKITIETLASFVLNKSQNYARKYRSVKTIVEFIYKKTASKFQTLLENNTFFDEIFLLSGTILESRRREIINYIKREANQSTNILLITTQVVEAGVDIDMDLGFKNVSLLDSDEQLAGRVNRNAEKEYCEVYLFHIDDAKILYGKDYRYQRTNELTLDERQTILKNKNFRKLYEKVLLSVDDSNNPLFKNSIKGYQNYINDLQYINVNKEFQIIDQQSETIFVPLFIPITIEGGTKEKQDPLLTIEDLSFLSKWQIYPVEHESEDFTGQAICGADIWKLYKSLIEFHTIKGKSNGSYDIHHKINFRILQSIMSKFCFSLISHSKDYQKLQLFGYEEYGYFYFAYYDQQTDNGKPYDYKKGLNTNAFSDSNFI